MYMYVGPYIYIYLVNIGLFVDLDSLPSTLKLFRFFFFAGLENFGEI